MAIVVTSLWIQIPKVDKTVIGCRFFTPSYVKFLKFWSYLHETGL